VIFKKHETLFFLRQHYSIFIFFISAITSVIIYPSLFKYTFLVSVFVISLYCVLILFGKKKYVKDVLFLFPVLFVIFFYCFISLSSFYPGNFLPVKSVAITNVGGSYYNFMAFSLKTWKLSMPIKPSEKLKSLNNPYDAEELNNKLSYKNLDYVMDLSYYKGKYYLYFGITPALAVYLPFLLITKHFIPDTFVVLIFAVLSFLAALAILKKSIFKFAEISDEFLISSLSIMAVGMSSVFCYLIVVPRVYEVSIISGVFFTLLSFLFIALYMETGAFRKKCTLLFLAGFSIGLAVGCRPFYALTVLIQALVIVEFKQIKQKYKEYIFYVIPLLFCAIVLMLYNYLRFESVFEFGFKYQLNLLDMYNLKISLKETFQSLTKFIIYPPLRISGFPYFAIDYILFRDRFYEYIIGILFTAPFLLTIVGSYLLFKSKNIDVKYKKYISAIFLTGFVNLILVSAIGSSLYRYAADFSIYFIISAIIIGFYIISILKLSAKKIFIQYILMTLLLISIVFNCAILVSLSLGSINSNNQQLFYKITSFF